MGRCFFVFATFYRSSNQSRVGDRRLWVFSAGGLARPRAPPLRATSAFMVAQRQNPSSVRGWIIFRSLLRRGIGTSVGTAAFSEGAQGSRTTCHQTNPKNGMLYNQENRPEQVAAVPRRNPTFGAMACRPGVRPIGAYRDEARAHRAASPKRNRGPASMSNVSSTLVKTLGAQQQS